MASYLNLSPPKCSLPLYEYNNDMHVYLNLQPSDQIINRSHTLHRLPKPGMVLLLNR